MRAIVIVPTRASTGAYHLIACADARRKVRERNERNNCRASARLRVVAPVPAAPGPAPAAAAPAPVGADRDPGAAATASVRRRPVPEPEPLLAAAVTASTPQHVVRFDVTAPGALLSSVPVTGLAGGERVVALDRRAADGVLVAYTDAGRLLDLDADSGATRRSPPRPWAPGRSATTSTPSTGSSMPSARRAGASGSIPRRAP